MWTLEQQQFVMKCDELRRNDPTIDKLDLGAYGKLAWDDVIELASALQGHHHQHQHPKNKAKASQKASQNAVRHLRDVRLVLGSEQRRMCHDAAVALSHFLRHSPSLRTLTIVEEEEEEEGSEDWNAKRTNNSINTSILLDSISHRQILTKLTLAEVHMERPSLLETILSTTRTLSELDLIYQTCPLSLAVTKAMRTGLTANTTLMKLKFSSSQTVYMEEICAGLLEHLTLTVLFLDVPVSVTVAQVLRCLLECNKMLRVLDLTPRAAAGILDCTGIWKTTRKPPVPEDVVAFTKKQKRGQLQVPKATDDQQQQQQQPACLRPILEGLANNKGLQDVSLHIVDTNTDTDTDMDLSAWTEMLQQNSSMMRLELHVQAEHNMHGHDNQDHDSRSDNISSSGGHSTASPSLAGLKLGLQTATAIAKGLGKNSTLQSLHFVGNLQAGAFHGPTWQDTLQRNDTLKELSLSACHIGNEGVQFVARGMLQNRSLQVLDLTGNDIGNTGGVTLTRALTNNRTLKALNMAHNELVGPDSAAAMNELLKSNRFLKRLDLCNNKIGRDGGAGLLAEGLSQNKTLETLDLENNTLDSAGFLAICDSLHRGGGLRVLVAEQNDLFSHDCDKALRGMLGSKALRIQDAGPNDKGGKMNRSIAMGGGKMSLRFSMEIIVTIVVLVSVGMAWLDKSGYYVRISWFEPSDDFLNASDLVERASEDASSLEY